MILDDDAIETLRVQCGGKVGVVDWDGHQIVFRRPDRNTMRDYRRKQDTSEKPDALDQLAQATIVAFDGESDPVRCRTSFLAFLDQYPAFTSSGKYSVVMLSLSGMVEHEAAADLGKGVSVRVGPPPSSPSASPSGSAASSRGVS